MDYFFQSTIRLCFHERRLQYTEREQIDAWQKARPGEKLLEVDVPLSYGVTKVLQQNIVSNVVEFTWDPTKEVGVYIKVLIIVLLFYLISIFKVELKSIHFVFEFLDKLYQH